MGRLHAKLITAILLCVQTASAQLNTFAENVPIVQSNWDYQNDKYIYDTTYYDANIGGINIGSVSITVKPHGSYLEVTENSSIGIINSDIYKQFHIGGNIFVPKKSVIASLFISDGTNGYSAEIMPNSASDNPVDTTLGDAVATLKLDNQNNYNNEYSDYNDSYYLTLHNTLAGKDYQLIIRYLVPNTGNSNPDYPLQILCNSNSSKKPGSIEMNYLADSTERKYKISIGNLNYQLTNGSSLQVPFQNSFSISSIDQAESNYHLTDISEGDWKGKYLLLNTSIPNSVQMLLSKPIEAVVLWRWNRPSSFVRKYDQYNDYKFLSSYGSQAVTQAQAIRNLITEVSNSGNKTALVHSIQYKKPETFPLCKKGSTAYSKIDNYLQQFTGDYFLNSGYFEYDIAPTNPTDTLLDSARFEFLKSMNIVQGLYSNGSGIMKHLIILSCGPAQISRNILSLEEVDSLFSDVSVDCDQAVWKDVDFATIKSISKQSSLVQVAGFKMPEFRPSSILLQVSNSSKTYTFPLSPDQSSFSMIAKSDGDWNPQLTWTGYDKSGALFSTAKSTVQVYSSKDDTGLVKLWAENNERLSEKKETDVELKYGVVSEDYCMKIFPSFKGYDSTATAYAAVDKNYAYDNDSLRRISSTMSMLRTVSDKFKCFFSAGQLHITIPHNGDINRIRIYSLSGKLLADFDPKNFKSSSGYVIRLTSLLRRGGITGILILHVDSSKGVWKEKVVVR